MPGKCLNTTGLGVCQAAVPQTPEFIQSLLHDAIPIEPKRQWQRGSVQLIFSIIRLSLVGKNRVILPYDGKDALRFELLIELAATGKKQANAKQVEEIAKGQNLRI
jgi:hypothetical protein